MERAKIFEDENRFNILNSIRMSMIGEMQELRTTASKITITTTGVMLLLVSFLYTKGVSLSIQQKWVLTLGILVFFIICVFVARAFEIHFRNHAIVVNKINRRFGVYKKGVFIDDDYLFVEEWKEYGKTHHHEPIFRTSYIAAAMVSCFSLIALWVW